MVHTGTSCWPLGAASWLSENQFVPRASSPFRDREAMAVTPECSARGGAGGVVGVGDLGVIVSGGVGIGTDRRPAAVSGIVRT